MNSTGPNDNARHEAMDFARALVPVWQKSFGPDLLGVYIIGSLAHGGFSRRFSDIDIAVIAEASVSQQLIDQLRNEADALSPDWGSKVSVFWADRQFSGGRFPPLDRIDYLDHAVVLTERRRIKPLRPTLEEIRAYLHGSPFENWAKLAREFAGAPALEPNNRKRYLRALLYPARLCFSYVTGLTGSNDDAVAYLRARTPCGLNLTSIERALECRRTDADPDSLFELRGLLPTQVDACAVLIAANPAS
jgi:predicted nucleotidyltransferase